MRIPIYKKLRMQSNNDLYQGQSVEEYVREAETTNQPIEGGAPEIFTPRKDGVKPETDIRTDRWAVAQEAMNKVARSYRAKRLEIVKNNEKQQDNKQSAETA